MGRVIPFWSLGHRVRVAGPTRRISVGVRPWGADPASVQADHRRDLRAVLPIWGVRAAPLQGLGQAWDGAEPRRGPQDLAVARPGGPHAQRQEHPGSLDAGRRSVLRSNLRKHPMASRVSLNGQREVTPAPTSAVAPTRGLRLVEVGLHWPLETFIRLKLTRLAERG